MGHSERGSRRPTHPRCRGAAGCWGRRIVACQPAAATGARAVPGPRHADRHRRVGMDRLENYQLARLIGSIALMLILFEAGLSTGFREFKTVLAPAASMAVLATLITALVTGLAAAALFKLPLDEGLLLGAIL